MNSQYYQKRFEEIIGKYDAELIQIPNRYTDFSDKLKNEKQNSDKTKSKEMTELELRLLGERIRKTIEENQMQEQKILNPNFDNPSLTATEFNNALTFSLMKLKPNQITEILLRELKQGRNYFFYTSIDFLKKNRPNEENLRFQLGEIENQALESTGLGAIRKEIFDLSYIEKKVNVYREALLSGADNYDSVAKDNLAKIHVQLWKESL